MISSPTADRRSTPAGYAGQMARCVAYLALAAGVATVLQLGASLAILAQSPDPAKPALVSRRASGGALVICGGGRLPDQIRNRFLELAGGPDAKIVVIPTANSMADRPEVSRSLDVWKTRGAADVRILHTRSRQQADDPGFVRPLLDDATGVWIGGGSQSKLTDVYLGTEVERQLKALLARGGVIGGTSAGAAVMSRLMIAGGRTEARVGQGFDFMPGTVIDQHFLKRNRLKRLLGVVRQYPDLVGLGIDEQTALVVDIHNHRLSVVGDSYVIACVPDGSRKGKVGEPTPVAASSVSPIRVETLKAGDEADFTALREQTPNAVVSAINLDAM